MRFRSWSIAIYLTLFLSPEVARAWDSSQYLDLKVGTEAIIETQKLHPTQFRVGQTEVDQKRDGFEKMGAQRLEEYLKSHPCPVVVGPDGTLYITDEQHRANASYEAELHSNSKALDKNGQPTMYMKVRDSY